MAFGVASSGLLAIWREREIIEPVANTCIPHPEIHKTFSPLGAFSAGAAWSGARRDPSESPQPGAIPTTARAN